MGIGSSSGMGLAVIHGERIIDTRSGEEELIL